MNIFENRAYAFLTVGFIILLISIPLTFTVIKRNQTAGSNKSVTDKNKSQQTQIKAGQVKATTEVPKSSPLSDLSKLVEDKGTGSPSQSPSPTPPQETTANFGAGLNFRIHPEGRPGGKDGGSAFLGLAAGQTGTRPTYLLTFTLTMPDSGTVSDLSLAGLDNGASYTAYIKGSAQIDTAVTFTMSPAGVTLNNNQAILLLSGDLNEDNTINSADYTLAKNLYGKNSRDPGWNSRADFNLDGVINNLDLGYITKNFAKTGDSGLWYSPPPQASSSAAPRTGGLAVPLTTASRLSSLPK